MQKKSLAFVFLSASILVLSIPYHVQAMQQLVLGISDTSTIAMQPTADGPGLLLPNNPLFFLDQLKQAFRLSLALTPEAKAQVHMKIAGERLAELRLMLQQNDQAGIQTDLHGIQDNMRQVGEQMKVAQLLGKDIKQLSQNLNTGMKEKQATLRSLEKQTAGVLREQIAMVLEGSKAAKNVVEDGLPADLKQNEIADDVVFDTQDKLLATADTATQLQNDLQSLTQTATKSGQTKVAAAQQAQEVVSKIKALSQTLNSAQKQVAGAHN